MSQPARPARPVPVRVLAWLLAVAAVTTVLVELLNWWYVPEGGFALAVRTGWGLLRSLGFLLLIVHVRAGRAGARPFGLILAVTTVFAVGRLIVPRSGPPALAGVVGFGLLLALCVAVVAMLYRSPTVGGFLTRHPGRLVVDRAGISWQRLRPARPPVRAWLLTSRVAAFTYSPLMLVPALVAIGVVADGRVRALPLVVFWLVMGFATSYAVLLTTFFLLRHRQWARGLLVAVTLVVLAIDLPLCWVLLGLDGLIRDGAPLVAAAGLALYGLWRAARAPDDPAEPDTSPVTDTPLATGGR